LGTYSFHETKNIISGEGGALLVNDSELVMRAEVIREKGTDRSRFFRGQVDKYTWQEVGSSYLPGEIMAAFLWAQLEDAEKITHARLAIWRYYHETLASLESEGLIRRPIVPSECGHNAHMYYVLVSSGIDRQSVLTRMNASKVNAVFHYVPLHSSPAGLRYGRIAEQLSVTERQSELIIRLPLWIGISFEQQDKVVSVLREALRTDANESLLQRS
jgi:dTDP-4-amino-4,6-dideoxygalactose transaminase